jgi:integration host factor subunit beta
MNKGDFIEAVRDETGLTKGKAEAVADIFFGKIARALINGERAEIRGFCSFYVKKYRPYTGRNPKTGERIQVAGKKLPFFKCGKELRERVDYKQI